MALSIGRLPLLSTAKTVDLAGNIVSSASSSRQFPTRILTRPVDVPPLPLWGCLVRFLGLTPAEQRALVAGGAAGALERGGELAPVPGAQSGPAGPPAQLQAFLEGPAQPQQLMKRAGAPRERRRAGPRPGASVWKRPSSPGCRPMAPGAMTRYRQQAAVPRVPLVRATPQGKAVCCYLRGGRV